MGALPPSLPPLITLVVVLRGSFSGIRQQEQRSGIAHDQQLERRTDGRTDDAAFSSAAAACSAIRVANKATERRKGTKAEKEKERGANAASETATALRRRRNRCSLQRAANVQKRKSERRLPIYLFYLVFLQWPYRITGEFQGQRLEIDEWRGGDEISSSIL